MIPRRQIAVWTFHHNTGVLPLLSLLIKRMPFYAVARGHKPGIYESWPDCQAQVTGFNGARYKKFPTKPMAEEFIRENQSLITDKRTKPNPAPLRVEAAAHQSSSTPMRRTSQRSSSQDGSLSPTLLEMKKGMKKLQKELAILRSQFDEYVAQKSSNGEVAEQTRQLHTSSASSGSKKRRLDSVDSQGSRKAQSKSSTIPDKSKFSVDSDGFVIVYTDGSCEANGRYGAKAGVGVYFGPNHPLNVSEPVQGRATNNMAEIQAATYALELSQASGFSKVAVHTDSQFMINCMTSWMKNWKKNNWRKADGEPVKNKEELIALDLASDGLAVKWVHVRGHAGHVGNEEADQLARAGAQRYNIDS